MMITQRAQIFFSHISQFFEGKTTPDQRYRSRAGILLTLALVPLLLGVLACLPVPVGDPEKSRIDPTMSGIWIAHNGGDAIIMVLDPYDKRTWLLSFIEIDTGQNREPGVSEPDPETSPLIFLQPDYEHPLKIERLGLHKSWLTKIKGVTLITWESKTLSDTLPEMVPEIWWVWRVRKEGDDMLYLDMIDPGVDGLDKVKTRKEAEKIIRRHVDDPEFFSADDGPLLKFQKVPESDYSTVARLLKDLGIIDNL